MGLADRMAGGQPGMGQEQGMGQGMGPGPGAGGGSQAELVEAIKQIMQLLMQGVTPDELIAKGVPEELVMKAVELLQRMQQEQGGQGGQPAPGPEMQGGQPGMM